MRAKRWGIRLRLAWGEKKDHENVCLYLVCRTSRGRGQLFLYFHSFRFFFFKSKQVRSIICNLCGLNPTSPLFLHVCHTFFSFFPLTTTNAAGPTAKSRVPEDHIFAYPPSSGSGDTGKTPDADRFPSPVGAPSGDDFFYATRRFAEPPLNMPSPRVQTAALAAGATALAAGAAGAAAAGGRTAGLTAGTSGAAGGVTGSASGEWPSPMSAAGGVSSGTGTGSGTGSSGTGSGSGGTSSSLRSSSTISAVSAGSMETKHDVGGDVREASLSPASRAGGSGRIAAAGGAAATAAAVLAASAAGKGAGKSEDEEDVADVEVRNALIFVFRVRTLLVFDLANTREINKYTLECPVFL